MEEKKPLLQYEGLNKRNSSLITPGSSVRKTPRENSFQFKALMRKNFSLQLQQKGTIICQLIAPLVLLMFVGILQLALNSLKPDNNPVFIARNEEYLNWRPFISSNSVEDYLIYWNTNNLTNDYVVGSLTANGSRSGLLGNINQWEYFFPDGNTTSYSPFFTTKTSIAQMQEEIIQILSQLNKQPFSNITNTDLYYQLPNGAVNFRKVDSSLFQIAYDLMYNDNQFYQRLSVSSTANAIRTGLNTLLSQINHAFVSTALNTPTVQVSEQAFPYYSIPNDPTVMDLVGAALFPFALGFLLPVYIYTIVFEKEHRLREMMKMMGLKMRTYWAINYFYDFIMYLLVCTLFILVEVAFKVRFFMQSSPLLIVLLFVLWGTAQVSLAFFLSVFFRRSGNASIFGYLLVVVGIVSGEIFNSIVYALPKRASIWYMMYPPWAFYRGIYLMFLSCLNFECIQWRDVTSDSGNKCPHSTSKYLSLEIAEVLYFLSGHTVVLFILAIYLDEVLPQEYGVRSSPIFFIKYLTKICFPQNQKETLNDNVDIENSESDVTKEKKRVLSKQYSPDCPLVIERLRKRFTVGLFNKKEKVAVKDFCLAVERGECLGLLGPNGAGKSTLISMITGLIEPSSGNATVMGYSILSEMDEVHKYIGVCPQFDILWPSLTAKEHLLFYARLKGVRASQIELHVMNLLNEVGLTKHVNKKISEMSGGMRRRLSVAISLVGSPVVVFLDEQISDQPTTGLDPISKRQLWDVLSKKREDKALILTTHSMEEANVLSSRIGIINHGELQALGNPVTLRNSFGKGYILEIMVEERSRNAIDSIVKGLFPNANLKHTFENSFTYEIPMKDVNIDTLFSELNEKRETYGIKQWGINQTSLEDVFVAVCGTDDSE